jgi:hypothetical protein
MARPGAGRKKNHVEAEWGRGQRRIAGQVVLGGPHDALLIDREQCLALIAGTRSGLDLDKGGDAEAFDDQIDFADRGF